MTYLEVEVRPGRESGGADVADRLPAGDRLADRRGDRRHVGVPALEAQAMRDHDEVAVATGVEAREGDDTDTGRVDRCALRLGEVQARVPAPGWNPAEAVPDGTGHRPEEPDRGARGGADNLTPLEGVER